MNNRNRRLNSEGSQQIVLGLAYCQWLTNEMGLTRTWMSRKSCNVVKGINDTMITPPVYSLPSVAMMKSPGLSGGNSENVPSKNGFPFTG